MLERAREFVRWFFDALFPRFCISCRKEGDVLCRTCVAQWRPSPPTVTNRTFAFFAYADPLVRKLIHAWKYEFDERAWSFLKKEMLERSAYLQMWVEDIAADIIAPVPLFYVKRNERGFDQAQEIARVCEAVTGIHLAHVVARTIATAPQAQKTKEKRLLSYAYNPFSLRRAESIQEGNVLLIDDVLTTGATMEAVEQVLQGRVVGRVVLAMGVDK